MKSEKPKFVTMVSNECKGVSRKSAEEGHSPESTPRIEESRVVENHPPYIFVQCFLSCVTLVGKIYSQYTSRSSYLYSCTVAEGRRGIAVRRRRRRRAWRVVATRVEIQRSRR